MPGRLCVPSSSRPPPLFLLPRDLDQDGADSVYPSQPVIGQFAESLNPSMEAYKRCASPSPPPCFALGRAARGQQWLTPRDRATSLGYAARICLVRPSRRVERPRATADRDLALLALLARNSVFNMCVRRPSLLRSPL